MMNADLPTLAMRIRRGFRAAAGAATERLLVLALAVCAAAGCGDGSRAEPSAKHHSSVAAADSVVLRLARGRGGVRGGLDSIRALVARDRTLGPQGHQLAHSLGRLAMAERGELSVLAECTPAFQSGCYHGVLEGYFLKGGRADAASIRAICAGQASPGRPGYEALECWHGLGHGLMVQFRGDAPRALSLCDALQTPLARRECQDGVFMERASRAVGLATLDVEAGHAHGGEGAPASAPMSKAELRRLCEDVEARYQPSCWLYQPAPLAAVHGMDPGVVLRGCDAAPAAAVGDCYRGFGKLYLAWRNGDTRAMIRACRRGDLAYATACLLGGVEYFTDLEWTIEPGVEFCGRVPGNAKAACYELVGRRLALIHPAGDRVRSACQRVEPEWVQACLAGARRAES